MVHVVQVCTTSFFSDRATVKQTVKLPSFDKNAFALVLHRVFSGAAPFQGAYFFAHEQVMGFGQRLQGEEKEWLGELQSRAPMWRVQTWRQI